MKIFVKFLEGVGFITIKSRLHFMVLWIMLKFVLFAIAKYGIVRRDMLILVYNHEMTPLTNLFILTSSVQQ